MLKVQMRIDILESKDLASQNHFERLITLYG
jgi:hypothetical protein